MHPMFQAVPRSPGAIAHMLRSATFVALRVRERVIGRGYRCLRAAAAATEERGANPPGEDGEGTRPSGVVVTAANRQACGDAGAIAG